MKVFRWLLVGLILLSFVAEVIAQTSVTTVPVGVIQVTVPGANNSSIPSFKSISIPFYKPPLYCGVVIGAMSLNTLFVNEPGWVVNQFNASPTFCRIKTGVKAGSFFRIVSNTNSQLILSDDVQIQIGDEIEILSANTLGNVFGSTHVPFQTGNNAAFADNVLFFNGTGWSVYYHNGINWCSSVVPGDQSEVVIPPDEALVILRRGLADISFYVSGTVPSTQEILNLPFSQSRFIGNRFPVDTTLLELGIHLNSNWRKGISAAQADNILLWNEEIGTWDSFFHDGIRWRKAGSFLNWDMRIVPAASGLFVIRKSISTGDVLLNLIPPYEH